ncbi:hypothetical protein RHSIM_Rhsim02G0195400 [Rhododendron simsii]|uniref:Uncharacterized protein n=1 Tax=Rhododendron simsii TaxID=118357 RepID=A0A834HDY7_RHOSS|nr:hypothetical protein RHSIM_Rhsim02G0195400 [Rhododendron simsii]
MEEQKLRYLSTFLDRIELSLEDCISFVRGLEQRVRNCYVESVYLSSDEFVKMILVDSSFIIEVIWRTNFEMQEDMTDYLNKEISLVDVVRRDMILLENQIPLFVMEGLFNLAFPHHPKTGELPFVQLSINYFRCVLLFNRIPQTISESEVKHFVDLLRLCHLPSTLRILPRNWVKFVTIPTARDLQEVGLSIRKGSSSNILDIQHAVGVLTIPQFGVNDDSEFELRNLIAFEICHCLSDSYIIDYVVFYGFPHGHCTRCGYPHSERTFRVLEFGSCFGYNSFSQSYVRNTVVVSALLLPRFMSRDLCILQGSMEQVEGNYETRLY